MWLFFLEHKALALVPTPGSLIWLRASEPYLIGQVLARELQQHLADAATVIGGIDEKLVEIAVAQAESQHGGDPAGVVGHVEVPLVRDLLADARTQVSEQLLARRLQPNRYPAVHPDASDFVIFV
jgi:hypothetical protein